MYTLNCFFQSPVTLILFITYDVSITFSTCWYNYSETLLLVLGCIITGESRP